ncbi:MAG: nuclear transport factor 2 family protein [Methylobacteriaceae bacterium]|nr:nuclear transport factor 2 family protein [Methylobacteriaceae bacterium]
MSGAPTASPAATTPREVIEERVRALIALRIAGRREESVAYYAPNVALEYPAPAPLRPYAGRFEGLEAIAQLRRAFTIETELIEDQLLDLIIEGDVCMTRRRVTYRNRGADAPLSFYVWERYQFENGLVRELVQQVDTACFARIVGRLEALASWGAEQPGDEELDNDQPRLG